MKVITIKRFMVCILFVLFIAFSSSKPTLAATNQWISIRSENFLVLGQVDERAGRMIAMRLEEFRAAFSLLLSKDYFDSNTPIVIFVFANDEAYKPFKPLYQGQTEQFVAGYIQINPDINYITLAANNKQSDLTPILFHEYVHLLINTKYGRVPLWFSEGLAEYYSAYDLINEKPSVRIGKSLLNRIQYLRTHQLIPLASLLSTNRYSPLYHEHDKNGIFYAQSWALIHYLLSDAKDERQCQLAEFLDLLATDAPIESAVKQAFGMDFTTFENRFKTYIRLAQYPEHIETLSERPAVHSNMQARVLSDAEAQAKLGDLLLRTDRPEEARTLLQNALALNPNLADAHISLGILLLSENRFVEAKEHLQTAIAIDPENYFAHYHYADLLRREGEESEKTVAGYAEKTKLIHDELKKVIELAPNFLDAYALLASIQIERNPQLDEATQLLAHAISFAPRRQEFKLLQAQIHFRNEEFDAARAILNMVARNRLIDPLIKVRTQTLLNAVDAKEKSIIERNRLSDINLATKEQRTQSCDMPEPGPQLKPIRFSGEQVCGQLVKVECDETGVVMFVKTAERTLKLHGEKLNQIRFVSYTRESSGKVECGQQSIPQLVLVTYRQKPSDAQIVVGEIVAVEFVPKDWYH